LDYVVTRSVAAKGMVGGKKSLFWLSRNIPLGKRFKEGKKNALTGVDRYRVNILNGTPVQGLLVCDAFKKIQFGR
jgi:hypothetical protein